MLLFPSRTGQSTVKGSTLKGQPWGAGWFDWCSRSPWPQGQNPHARLFVWHATPHTHLHAPCTLGSVPHANTHPHTCCCGVAACTQLKCAMNHTCLQLPLATTLHLSLGHTSVTPLENRHTCHTAATPVSLPAGNTAGHCHFSHLLLRQHNPHTPNTPGSTTPTWVVPHQGVSRAGHLSEEGIAHLTNSQLAGAAPVST